MASSQEPIKTSSYKMPKEGVHVQEVTDRLSIPCHSKASSSSEKNMEHGITHLSKIKWTKCTSMPITMFQPQVVVVEGKVYVGGGLTEDLDKKMLVILVYDPSKDRWTELPSSEVILFGMVNFQGNLLTIGGGGQSGFTGRIYHYKEMKKRWVEFIVQMPTERCSLSVIATDSAIVASGGAVWNDGENPVPCSIVEVYLSESSQWFTAEPLPHPCASVSTVMCTNKYLYLLGETEIDSNKDPLVANITDLISEQNLGPCFYTRSSPSPKSLHPPFQMPVSFHPSEIWSTLSKTPHSAAAAAILKDNLLTIGGHTRENEKQSSVYLFVHTTGSWIKMKKANLPVAIEGCSAAQLSSGRIIVVGGEGIEGRYTDSVFIGSLITT